MQNVHIETTTEKLTGILLKDDGRHVTLKLTSGYNIGVLKTNIVSMTIVEDSALKTQVEKDLKHRIVNNNAGLPKILILHTGGTIASKVDYATGAVTAKFEPAELIEMFPELNDMAHIESKLFRNMMSDDMRFSHYNLIAKKIEEELKADPSIKGIIITHGTDTMHYTSAALTFALEHISIPVILVGSQRSSDRGSSDSAINLISAVAFISNVASTSNGLAGVFICMHENASDDTCLILNGLNARKMHSSKRVAFKNINIPSIARIDHKTKTIEYLSTHKQSNLNSSGKLTLHLFNEDLKIGIVKSHPNMFHEELSAYKSFDGLVLEGTGLGHMPISEIDELTTEHLKIKSTLADLCAKIPVVMSVQTISGRVNMNVYSPGRELIDIGVIGNYSNLTTETAFIKLAWLLSQKIDVKKHFMEDYRGEISD